jgi:hypothetical protein
VYEPLGEEEYARWWEAAGFPELRQLLFWRWDPIGVDDGFPTTADEYDHYARVLLSRLRAGATGEQVAAYLLEVERSAMGQRLSDDAKLRDVGALVVAWFGESIPHWRDRSRPVR